MRRLGQISDKYQFSHEEISVISTASALHDSGKIAIPSEILNKPGKLTPKEQEVIRNHPRIGGEILKDFTSLPGICEGARYHHERYDGTGYNEGLKGEEIPFYARIICVADSYDAMAADRCYSRGLDAETIKKEIRSNMGTQFDPEIAAAMLELMEEGKVPIFVDIPCK